MADADTPPPPRAKTTRPALPPVRLEHLWFFFALSLVGIFIALVPTSPNDFWWHLKVGKIIASEGSIPTTNRFAWTIPPDAPFVYQSWLGELLFYLLHSLGGLKLVVFARNILGVAAFALVGIEARRRSGSWRLGALALFFAAAMTINNLTTRTQTWSWVPFALLLLLCSSYVEGKLRARWLALLPLLMLFWVNAHGAFVMGLLATGAFVAGETLRRLLRHPYALSRERLRALYLAFGGMIAAVLVNPLGIGVFGYLGKMLGDVPSQTLINEWQSPTPRTFAGMFFYLGVVALLAGFAFARRRPTLTDVLLVCGLAWQAFVGIRYVIWFGMAAMPVLVQCFAPPRTALQKPGASSPQRRVSRRERGGGAAANLAVVVVLAGIVATFQPWFKPWLPLPQPYQALFAPVPGAPLLFSADTPVAAAEHLQAEPCKGNLFNEMGYGSYLDWALYPETRVFIDPRVELYPFSLWQEYVDLTKGWQAAALLEKHDIACVMLDTALQPHLAEILPTLPGWQRTFANERSEVWRR